MADQKRYTHYFSMSVSSSFDSDIGDFDDALDQYLMRMDDLRNALLAEVSAKDLCRGIDYDYSIEYEEKD